MKEVLTILLAEDSPDDVVLLRQAFKKASVTSRLMTVQDGREVLDYLNGNGCFSDREVYPYPDIMLLDLKMPRVDGFEVLEAVRGNTRWGWLAVHVLSSSALDADVRKAYDLGANSYVIKPSGMGELVALVKVLHEWHRFSVLPANAGREEGLQALGSRR